MTNQPERDDDGRYRIDDEAYPSVTTVISSELDQPGLESWKESTPDWREKRDRAATVGTLAHRRILSEFTPRRLPLEKVPAKYNHEELRTDLETVDALWQEVRDELDIATSPYIEKTLWSDEYGYAGTADMIDGTTVVDLKTSKSVYESHRLQAAAYAQAARERDIADIDEAAIVTLDYRGLDSEVTTLDESELDSLFEKFAGLVNDYSD